MALRDKNNRKSRKKPSNIMKLCVCLLVALFAYVCTWVHAQSCPALPVTKHARYSLTRLLCPWNYLGKKTGVGCHFLLQGISLTQGLNPRLLHLPHWQVDSLPDEPPGKAHNDIIIYQR